MPLFQIDIEKRIGAEYWTNVYHTVADTMEMAIDVADILATFEQDIHKDVVNFTKMRVANGPGVGHIFTIIALNTFGGIAASTDIWPLFNIVRVLLNTAAYTRSGFKQYRLPLVEGDVSDGGVVVSGLITGINSALASAITAINALGATLNLENGGEVATFSVDTAVRGRQLKRGRKKPVLP